ncbi:phage major capsid protein [Bradyrhizobium sp. AUGA SZCCT0160]|uniref:phage major capsid protein n=1 Tax=Bradyrhizobium sp. AUGA SZCCT0160 TaxID=2807662 RepID=UPI001BA7B5C2|nr:phage major capsid protein [Bradyrhizobium sp. AUGA SZCCT0160]MBR1190076.1 phage major capsid protein [Bradyrhizobium sp. AUGA SZCCT0160]
MSRPFALPRDIVAKLSAGDQLTRAAFVYALAAHQKIDLDAAKLQIAKAAVNPATTTTAAWAGNLSTQAVGDFVKSLAPISGASQVFERAFRSSLAGVNSILLPRRTAVPAAGSVPWVEQGMPIPVQNLSVTGVTLGPEKKLGVIVALTNETMASSAAEAVVTQMLRENAAMSLDATLFSNAAATAAAPAGLLNGISALTAVSGGGETAMVGDLMQLSDAIADATGDIVIIAHPKQANTIRIRRGNTFDIPVFATRGVPAGTVIALDPQALAVGFGTEPKFESSIEAVIHQEDTSPVALGTVGSPNVVAAPSRSLFQTDCTSLRMLLPAAWAIRAPNSIAWVSAANWI